MSNVTVTDTTFNVTVAETNSSVTVSSGDAINVLVDTFTISTQVNNNGGGAEIGKTITGDTLILRSLVNTDGDITITQGADSINLDLAATIEANLTGNIDSDASSINVINDVTNINGAVSQNLTLSPDGFLFADTANMYVGSLTQATHITGTTIGAVGTPVNITAGHIVPATDTTYDLGSLSKKWRSLYLSGGSLFIEGQKVVGSTDGSIDFTTDNGENMTIFAGGTGTEGTMTIGSAGLVTNIQDTTVNIGPSVGGAGNTTIRNTLKASTFHNGDLEFSGTLINQTATNQNLTIQTDGTGYIHANTADLYVGPLSGAVKIDENSIGVTAGTLTVTGNLTGNVTGQVSDLSNHDTADVAEGTNKYYTDARVQTVINANTAGYITGFTEADPIFTASEAFNITATNKSQWNTAYGWGDHSIAGYITDYTVTQSDVTAHQASLSITESQISDLTHFSGSYADLSNKPTIPTNNNQLTNGASYITTYDPTEADITQHQAALSITESQISNLQTYLTAETNNLGSAVVWANVPNANITQGSVTQHQAALSITESQISNLQTYLTAEANDLSANVVWANVPNANITQGSVTQHQAALSITESQISNLQTYLTAEANDLSANVVWANVPNANITQGSVTQHQAALSVTESQISNLQSYLTAEANDLSANVVWANVPNANITQGSVTQHQAALSITESQISNLTHYTNANAITAVEGEATLALAGQVTFAQDIDVSGIITVDDGLAFGSFDPYTPLSLPATPMPTTVMGVGQEDGWGGITIRSRGEHAWGLTGYGIPNEPPKSLLVLTTGRKDGTDDDYLNNADSFGQLQFNPYSGYKTGAEWLTPSAMIESVATENHSATGLGTKLVFNTTTNGAQAGSTDIAHTDASLTLQGTTITTSGTLKIDDDLIVTGGISNDGGDLTVNDTLKVNGSVATKHTKIGDSVIGPYALHGAIITAGDTAWSGISLVEHSGANKPIANFTNPAFATTVFGGTVASPSAVLNNQRVWSSFALTSPDGSTPSTANFRMLGVATQDQTTSARGVKFSVETTPNGANSTTESLMIQHDTLTVNTGGNGVIKTGGNLSLDDDVTVTGTLDVNGTATLKGNVTLGDANTDVIAVTGKLAAANGFNNTVLNTATAQYLDAVLGIVVAGDQAYISDGNGGTACMAFFNGSDWKRFHAPDTNIASS